MAQSGVGFGTSGARGLVAAMTDRLCFAYTVGYLKHLAAIGEFGPGTSVVVSGDLRPSTPRILRACVAAIEWMKGDPVFCGFVPTPALSLYAFSRNIPSLMVTGSHIPADRNGIKFNRACGEFLKTDETSMREQEVILPDDWFDEKGKFTQDVSLPPAVNIVPEYIARYQDFFGSEALSGFKLGIYQHSAVGRDILVDVVEALGGQAVPLGRSDNFIPVDTEAVRSEDFLLSKRWAGEGLYDAILTTDGDSDRPLLSDRHGNWIRGDVLGILAARTLGAAAVTTPVSSNTALEKARFARSVRRTRIGSPFVVAEMTQAATEGFLPSVGYEANGGFLLATDVVQNGKVLAALPTRDAVLPMVCALIAARDHDNDLAALIKTLPPRFTISDRLAEMPTEESRTQIAILTENTPEKAEELGFTTFCGKVDHIDQTDGLRITFDCGDIIHLRPSGNAPELRVYVESNTPERAAKLLAVGMNGVSAWRI